MRSRVMPGSFVTMERRVPVKRLNSVDLPTLGRPTITKDGSRAVMISQFSRVPVEEQSECPEKDRGRADQNRPSRHEWHVRLLQVQGTCRPWNHGKLRFAHSHQPIRLHGSRPRQRFVCTLHRYSGETAFYSRPRRVQLARHTEAGLSRFEALVLEPYGA